MNHQIIIRISKYIVFQICTCLQSLYFCRKITILISAAGPELPAKIVTPAEYAAIGHHCT